MAASGPARALLLCLLALSALPLSAAERDPRVADLERLRGEIAKLQSRLSRAQERTQSLAGELDKTSLQLQLQERRVDEAHTARTLAEDRTAAIAAQVGTLETRLVRVREDLRSRLVGLYRLGRAGYLRLLLALAPGQEVLPAMRQLRYLARRDGELMASFHETRARLTVEQGTLAAERHRLEGWVRQEEQRRAALATTRARQADLLARAERERKNLESRSGALAERAQKLSNLVAFPTPHAGSGPSGASIAASAACSTGGGGARQRSLRAALDPRYGTRVPHHGVDCDAARQRGAHGLPRHGGLRARSGATARR